MFQLAREKQRPVRSADVAGPIRTPAPAVGKISLTERLGESAIAPPDYYALAVDSARRELDAVRSTALPAYVAALRTRDRSPMQREIELVRAGLQVRHLLTCANRRVLALEASATHRDPMVVYLRARVDRTVARAVTLGVYRNADNELPRRVEMGLPKKKPPRVREPHKTTAHRPPPEHAIGSPTESAQITRPARTRFARGTARIRLASPRVGAPAEQPSTRVRPGFR